MGALACALMVAACTGDIGKLEGLEEETSDPSAIPNGSVDPGGSQAGPLETASCTAGTVAPSPARYWRLSDAQYSNAIKDLLPMVTPVEVKTPGTSDQQFQNNAELFRVSGPIAAQYQTTAEKAAAFLDDPDVGPEIQPAAQRRELLAHDRGGDDRVDLDARDIPTAGGECARDVAAELPPGP